MAGKRIIAAIALVSVAVVGWLVYSWSQRRQTVLVYAGTVETREVQIGSKVGGRVLAVPVEEGQNVQAGAELVRFEDDELQAQRAQAAAHMAQAAADLSKMERGYRPEEIAQAQAAAAAQRAALDAAKNGPRPQELAQAQAGYQAAQAAATNAADTFRRMEMLVRGETISRLQYDNAKEQRDATAQQAEAARQRLALLQSGTRKEDLDAAQQRYAQAEAQAEMMQRGYRREDVDVARAAFSAARQQVAELDARLREAGLTAPAAGLVETVSVRPGDLVPPGRIVMTMLEPSQLWVKVYVPETDLSHVHLGQHAAVQVDSFPGRSFTGSVQEISSQAEFLPRNVQTRDDREHQVFGVKVRVDNADNVLKSGMSATVRLQ